MRSARPMRRRVSGDAVTLGLVVAVLAGCTDGPRSDGPSSTASTTPGTAGTAGPQPAGPRPSEPAPSPSGGEGTPGSPEPGPPVSVQGTVAAGVEAGCLVLETGDVTYELLGVPADVGPGDRVTVHGRVPPDIATTCQQGMPLQVERIEVD